MKPGQRIGGYIESERKGRDNDRRCSEYLDAQIKKACILPEGEVSLETKNRAEQAQEFVRRYYTKEVRAYTYRMLFDAMHILGLSLEDIYQNAYGMTLPLSDEVEQLLDICNRLSPSTQAYYRKYALRMTDGWWRPGPVTAWSIAKKTRTVAQRRLSRIDRGMLPPEVSRFLRGHVSDNACRLYEVPFLAEQLNVSVHWLLGAPFYINYRHNSEETQSIIDNYEMMPEPAKKMFLTIMQTAVEYVPSQVKLSKRVKVRWDLEVENADLQSMEGDDTEW